MRTARRQWVRSADTDGAFFLNTSVLAKQLGLLPTPAPLDPNEAALHKAMVATGLTGSDIASLAPAGPAAAAGASAGPSSSALPPLGTPERIAAVLSSADAGAAPLALAFGSSRLQNWCMQAVANHMQLPGHLCFQHSVAPPTDPASSQVVRCVSVYVPHVCAEMQAHITAQSVSADIERASRAGSTAGTRASTPGTGEASLSNKDLAKFVRDFELTPIPAEDMLWGLQGGAALHR